MVKSMRGSYVVFAGRMHPEAGADRAIVLARSAGKRIMLVSRVWELSERRYFTRAIEPLLGPDAVFLGDVTAERRRALLRRAAALLHPVRRPGPPVPFMIEALTFGTPIIAKTGSVVEPIVDDGRTGILCADDAEIASSLATSSL